MGRGISFVAELASVRCVNCVSCVDEVECALRLCHEPNARHLAKRALPAELYEQVRLVYGASEGSSPALVSAGR
jgi:hypothetical protein